MRSMERLKYFIVLLTMLFLFNSIEYMFVYASDKLSDRYNTNVAVAENKNSFLNDYSYEKTESKYLANNIPKYSGQLITSDAINYISTTGENVQKKKNENRDYLYIPQNNKSVSWNLNAPTYGLYEIQFSYKQVTDQVDDIVKGLKINNAFQFNEAQTIKFDKYYSFANKTIINNLGDEVQPEVVEKPQWTIRSLSNTTGENSNPYLFLLKKGENIITLEGISGEIEVSKVLLKAYSGNKAYSEMKKNYQMNGYKNANCSLKIEGESYENIKNFNSSNLQLNSTGDPSASPASYKHIIMNMIGNSSFKDGGDNITWNFNIQKAGLYKLGVRFLHIDGEGLTSGRAIKIDNEIPFKELEDYRFRYARALYYEALGNKNEDYLFYLDKGEHTITFEAQIGSFKKPLENLQSISDILNNVLKDITSVTGTNPDANYDYELDKKIHDLMRNVDRVIYLSKLATNDIDKYSTNISAVSNNIRMLTESFQKMKKNPDSIQRKYSEITNYTLSISDWIITLKEQPLGIDYFSFLPADKIVKNYKSSIISNILGGIYNFFISFIKDYNSVGISNDKNYKLLDVWISRGKEWGEIVKEIADNDFTTKEKIAIRLNVLPSGSISGAVNPLLLAINSGQNQPDVVLSLPATLPVEYAMRGVVLPIDDMPNLQKIKMRFSKGLMIPFEYNGKTYALPETSNFRVLFYRKDILGELNIKVPQTWDDVYNNVLPILYQNNKQMYFPEVFQSLGMFDAFLYQNGGSFYKNNNTKTALDSQQAFNACEELTNIYTKYGVPYTANFYNRFRTGEIPIGIGNFNTYVSLLSAAPEISSKWDIALIPGKLMPDGSINRKTGGIAGEADIVLASTKKKEECYKFLDWWTSKQTQVNFAKRLEGRLGKIAKWNTSNIEAFESLSIKKEHIAIIQETWNNSIEQPVVLGGYFTTRHLANALNKTIIQRLSIRNAMEEAVEQINLELERKQAAYKK